MKNNGGSQINSIFIERIAEDDENDPYTMEAMSGFL